MNQTLFSSSSKSNQDDFISPVSLPKTFIPPCFVDQPSVLSNWRYEYRHQAQQIDTHLYLGPLNIVKDKSFLEKRNIRILVSIADIRIIPIVVRNIYEPSGAFKCLSFDPGNRILNPMHIVSQLSDICQVIRQAEAEDASVLLYCETGNDSSAIAACAYLIYKYSYDLVKAVQTVQAQRFSINVDDTAKYNLKTFEDLCRARKPIEQMPRGVSKKAREREEDDEEQTQLMDILKGRQIGMKRRLSHDDDEMDGE